MWLGHVAPRGFLGVKPCATDKHDVLSVQTRKLNLCPWPDDSRPSSWQFATMAILMLQGLCYHEALHSSGLRHPGFSDADEDLKNAHLILPRGGAA
jgi:hypothetical protein